MCPTDAEIVAEPAIESLDNGYAKNEALKARAGKLMAEAESLLSEAGIERADPAKLKIEREVAQAIDVRTGEVLVSNAQPGWHYAWIFRDPDGQHAGRFVMKAKALGWQLVAHDMPEAREHTFVDGTRVVADCVLMRCTEELYKKFQDMDRIRRKRQNEGFASNLYDLARQVGVEVRTIDEMPGISDSLATAAELATRERRKMKIDKQIRNGTVQGIPSPMRAG